MRDSVAPNIKSFSNSNKGVMEVAQVTYSNVGHVRMDLELIDKGKQVVSYPSMAEGHPNNKNIVAINSLDITNADDHLMLDVHGERKRRREYDMLAGNSGNNSEGSSGHFLSVGPGVQAYREQ